MRFILLGRLAIAAGSIAGYFILPGPGYTAWDPSGYSVVEAQIWQPYEPMLRGCVMAFARDIATDKIGDDVFVHIVYASCPAAHEGGESYFIRYRRGHYNVNNGPATFAWDMDPETISAPVAGPLKMQPTLAVNRDHRLYAFWSDSANCGGAG